jgi:hypothetical protein
MNFEEKHEPIKVTLKNLKGKSFDLQTVFMSSEDSKKIEEIGRDHTLTNSGKIQKIMAIVFGEKDKFFAQFSNDLLADIQVYVADMQKKN